MPLSRLIYFSSTSAKLNATSVKDVADSFLEQARAENRRNDLTGVLVETLGGFLQLVEGRRRPLSDLLRRLYADPRHEQLRLPRGVSTDQDAAVWRMADVSSDG
jgi:hypothetical protein